MLNYIKSLLQNLLFKKSNIKNLTIEKDCDTFPADLRLTEQTVRKDLNRTSDLIIRKFRSDGFDFMCITMENMVDKDSLNKQVIEKILSAKGLPLNPKERFLKISDEILSSPDQQKVYSKSDAYYFLMSGMALIFIENYNGVISIGVQDFPIRSVSTPLSETVTRGSYEAFGETLRLNMAMIRRRIKSPDLVFENMNIGTVSKTEISICYLKNAVSEDILNQLRQKLCSIKIETVLESGYIQPFLEERAASLFSTVGTSERPDTVCGKISEGRIAVLVDGTPFCLYVPFLFSENFQSFDDYSMNPFFVTFVRILKYLSFFLSTLLPGIYVAIAEFNPEIFPEAFFFKVVDADASTPFSIMGEALLIHIIYEIMREAGLRLPKSVGHAVSIVGALVIGEAAVTAGLIGAPMIIVVAITALASYVTPEIYYPIAVLRLIFILIGGWTGIFGVILGFAVLCVEICSLNSFSVPFTAPISPFDKTAMRDTFIMSGWRRLSKHTAKIQNLTGSQYKER